MNAAFDKQQILVWGINYAPEETGIAPFNTDLCAYLHERGWDVSMVTAFPYYPHWRKRAEDRWRFFRSENDGGVNVYRCGLYVPSRPTSLRRILHEASFAALSFFSALARPRPNAILVISPPLILGAAGRLLSWIKKCPYFFHVQDMQPDAAVEMGLLRRGLFTKLLYRLESIAHRGAAQVSGITEGMVRLFKIKGVPFERIALFPNWNLSEDSIAPAEQVAENFRGRHGIPPEAFLLAYSGNLGRKQGLSVLLDAAKALHRAAPGVCTVIAGDGVEKAGLEERVRSENLPNVKLLPLLPAPDYRALLREADLCVVTQQRGSGALFFPSKLLSILSAAKPVIAVADDDSELRRAVAEGDFGLCVPPESPNELAAAVAELSRDRGKLAAMSERGPIWMKRFSRRNVLDEFYRNLAARALPLSVGAGQNAPAATNGAASHTTQTKKPR